jgi:hypothetical protein
MKLSKFYTLFTLGLLVFSQMSAQIPAYVPTNGLVGWYPFNGNANDESNKGTNGTLNAVTSVADRFGFANKAYYFNGTSSIIDLGVNSSMNSITGDFTMSLWFKAEAPGMLIASYAPWPQGWRFAIRLYDSGYAESGYLPSTLNWQKSLSKKYSIQLNNWAHLVFTRKGGETKTYINGILNKSNSFSTNTIPSTSATTKFGVNFPSTNLEYYKGILDDIGFWDRALDTTEIKNLYVICQQDEITANPSDSKVTTTQNANFKTTAVTGSNIQWQSNPNAMGWSNVPANSTYNGGATNSLTINKVQISNHNQKFRAIAANGPCKDTSAEAKIIITDTCINTKSVSVADTLKFAVNLTGVAPPNNRNAMKVYPNPTNSAVVIDNGNFTAMANYIVKIENSIGQQVFFSKVTQQQFTVDVSTLGGKGVYTLTVLNPAGKLLETKKIVLQ